MPGLGQGFCNTTKLQTIIGIVERLRLRSSKRLTVNVIRNQQRNRTTLDETNIALPQKMEYGFSPLVGLRQSFDRIERYSTPAGFDPITLGDIFRLSIFDYVRQG